MYVYIHLNARNNVLYYTISHKYIIIAYSIKCVFAIYINT